MRLKERESFRRLLHLGLIDTFREFNSKKKEFSWWDYRYGSWEYNRGMRIDHILASPLVIDQITAVEIISNIRCGICKTSDHAPVCIHLLK